MIWLIFGICACALILSIYNCVENIRTYNEYKVFNENVKNWSLSLNDDMKFAINQSVFHIIKDLDQKLRDYVENNNGNNLEENEESSSRED